MSCCVIITHCAIFAPMNKILFLILLIFSFISESGYSQSKNTLCLAFYNLENLFDTIDNPQTDDQDFLPTGVYQWNSVRYDNKLKNMSKVIQSLNDNTGPDILGVCEIENRSVLHDLTKQSSIKSMQYDIVHRDSPDERGIDVALLFKKKKFIVLQKDWISPDLSQDKTRESLAVQLQDMRKKNFWVLVVHAPSRREGKDISEKKRLAVSKAVTEFISKIQKEYPGESIFIVGDFNDTHKDMSMQEYEKMGFKNAMAPIDPKEIGSLMYNKEWFIFDQILYFNAQTLSASENTAKIFAPEWLKQHGDPKYEGSPLRTFGGKKYLNGYSDHFPVSIQIN